MSRVQLDWFDAAGVYRNDRLFEPHLRHDAYVG